MLGIGSSQLYKQVYADDTLTEAWRHVRTGTDQAGVDGVTVHWFRRQEHVLLQPHLGGFTDEGYESPLAPAIDNVMAFLDGQPRQLINPEVLQRQRRV